MVLASHPHHHISNRLKSQQKLAGKSVSRILRPEFCNLPRSHNLLSANNLAFTQIRQSCQWCHQCPSSLHTSCTPVPRLSHAGGPSVAAKVLVQDYLYPVEDDGSRELLGRRVLFHPDEVAAFLKRARLVASLNGNTG
jgi:hypothetical protein